MLRTILLATVIVSFAVFAIPSRSYALDKADPTSCPPDCGDSGGWGGIPGPGPSDPSLGGSEMPPGGDQRKDPRADKAADKPDAPEKSKEKSKGVKSIGRVKVPPSPPGPPMSICDSARNARARNSPAAPNLEAQCRSAAP